MRERRALIVRPPDLGANPPDISVGISFATSLWEGQCDIVTDCLSCLWEVVVSPEPASIKKVCV